MSAAPREILVGAWSLKRARCFALSIVALPSTVRPLVRTLFSNDPEARKRAADVARRITEVDPKPLHPYADQLPGLLVSLPTGEHRTRWHLGLVVARIAHTRDQRLRAARLMLTLAQDEGNVVRCSAVEGLATIALHEPCLRSNALEMIEAFLRTGTAAMKCRARHAARLLRLP